MPPTDNHRREFLDPKVLSTMGRLTLQARTLVEGSFSGKHKSPHRGASVEFSQYRKYVPGDDIKNIDWRVYGRSDRFYIKEFEADTNLRCYLVIDCSGSMGYASAGMSKFDIARRMSATLAHLLVQQGDAVGLQCFTDALLQDIPPRTNAKHLRAIFDVLESAEPSGRTDIVNVLHNLAEKIRRRALVIVFSDFFTDVPPLLDCFQHFVYRKHDLVVFHVVDQEERDFSMARPVRFVDLEGGGSMVTDPGLIRSRYLRVFSDYMDSMREGCLQFNVDYRLSLTSASYEKVLTDFLLDRMRRKQG